jgi:hypothetical protein
MSCCPINSVPKDRIPYCPFSFYDIAKELDTFLYQIMPEYDKLVNKLFLTPQEFNAIFEYLNPRIEAFLEILPYPSYQKIYTIVRTDGVVVTDKISSSPDTYMVVTNTYGSLTNISGWQLNTAGLPNPPTDLPVTLSSIQAPVTIKVFPNDSRYQQFESFTNREEFMQANTATFGWSARTGFMSLVLCTV